MRLAILILSLMAFDAIAQIPHMCQSHMRDLKRSAWRTFGPDAPIATLASQMHVESACKSNAVSPVGAQGLLQFMPLTAKDMAERHAECQPANPFNPEWALRCRDLYLKSLIQAQRSLGLGLDECNRWVFGLRAYNGGLGWINWDRGWAARNSVNADNWVLVEPFRGANPRTGKRRSDASHRENTEYVHRILYTQHRYIDAGYGRGICYGG